MRVRQEPVPGSPLSWPCWSGSTFCQQLHLCPPVCLQRTTRGTLTLPPSQPVGAPFVHFASVWLHSLPHPHGLPCLTWPGRAAGGHAALCSQAFLCGLLCVSQEPPAARQVCTAAYSPRVPLSFSCLATEGEQDVLP